MLFNLVLAWQVLVPSGQAHSPFDSSSKAALHSNDLELTVTLGLEAADTIMTSAGVDAATRQSVLTNRLQGDPASLPLALADKLFVVTANDQRVVPIAICGFSEGSDSMFIITYPRPHANRVDFEACYFKNCEIVRGGVMVIEDEDGEQLAAAMLSPSSTKISVPLFPRELELATRSSIHPGFVSFLKLGFEHILLGFDHLLFLGALLIGVKRIGPTLAIITCFTLAHSITLALAALEWVTISSRVVEPLIAASIIVVCIENFVRRDAPSDRYWLAGGFGLIHGFGFAGALRETGLASSGGNIVMPLFSFNLGVETGQLAVATLVVPLLFALRRQPAFGRFGTSAISLVVMCISSYWFFERIFAEG